MVLAILEQGYDRVKKELWLRLKRYHFEHIVPPQLLDHVTAAFGRTDASTKAFAGKLSRKLNWTTGYSLRALDEYKKFLYLGMVSDFPVTPSRVIDQVWHEHLLFTRAYREFCRDVLGREFDHNPELVATDDQTGIFQSQYEATLDLYETEFHVEPPNEIWSVPKFRPRAMPRKARLQKDSAGSNDGAGDTPLYLFFDGSGDGGQSHGDMAEFGGGGGFSGGGGESSWGDHSPSESSAGSDGDGGGSSSDSGSSCSSGCGGGGE